MARTTSKRTFDTGQYGVKHGAGFRGTSATTVRKNRKRRQGAKTGGQQPSLSHSKGGYKANIKSPWDVISQAKKLAGLS